MYFYLLSKIGKFQNFQIKISKKSKSERGVPFRQYSKNSVLGIRGGGGQPLNGEPLIDVLRPSLIVSAIVAIS